VRTSLKTARHRRLMATCATIVAEIKANNVKVKELAGEEGAKVAS